jgi:chromosome segregation ATPase
MFLAFVWCSVTSFGQPATSSQQSPPPAQSSSQDQSPSQAQTPSEDKPDSVAEAARKAKEKKAAAAKHKVLTEDDLSGMTGGVSVVGSENTKPVKRTSTKVENGEDAQNGEEYWRGKAQPLLQEIADIDQAVAQLREEIKKYGNGGFDVTTGFKDNVAYVADRNGQIEKLQKKKVDLQKQLADLEEEGRKAGAQPAWFR